MVKIPGNNAGIVEIDRRIREVNVSSPLLVSSLPFVDRPTVS